MKIYIILRRDRPDSRSLLLSKEVLDLKEHKIGMKGASPFDDSAASRLKHMGLLDEAGGVEQANIAAFGRIIAGLFFNDLCDHYNEVRAVAGVYGDLNDYLGQCDYRRLLLRYALQYDMMHQVLPPTVWWLSGTKEVVQVFLDCFMKELGALVAGLESEGNGGVGPL